MTDLEIDGLLTQLICAFALHKEGFLVMLLMFLVVILVLFPNGKSLILLL